MTFEQFYKEVLKESGIYATEKYVRILWEKAYTIKQTAHNLETMND